MSYGSEFVDPFEGPDAFVWSSQTSMGCDRKKGREVLDAAGTGTRNERAPLGPPSENRVAFTYLGLVVPTSHAGDRPMSCASDC